MNDTTLKVLRTLTKINYVIIRENVRSEKEKNLIITHNNKIVVFPSPEEAKDWLKNNNVLYGKNANPQIYRLFNKNCQTINYQKTSYYAIGRYPENLKANLKTDFHIEIPECGTLPQGL